MVTINLVYLSFMKVVCYYRQWYKIVKITSALKINNIHLTIYGDLCHT